MITILNSSDKHLLKMARKIKTINRKIDTKQFQILLHSMNNDEHERVSTQFDLRRLLTEKEELMALMNNI